MGHKSVRTTALYWKCEEEVSEVVVREWLERSPDYLSIKWLERKVLVQVEFKQEREYASLIPFHFIQQTIQVLTKQKEELVKKVRELEKQLENRVDLGKVRKQEGVEERSQFEKQKIRNQIELRPKKVYA